MDLIRELTGNSKGDVAMTHMANSAGEDDEADDKETQMEANAQVKTTRTQSYPMFKSLPAMRQCCFGKRLIIEWAKGRITAFSLDNGIKRIMGANVMVTRTQFNIPKMYLVIRG